MAVAQLLDQVTGAAAGSGESSGRSSGSGGSSGRSSGSGGSSGRSCQLRCWIK